MGILDNAKQQLTNAVKGTKFSQLGLVVRDDQVYNTGGRLLGPLSGAQAELTDTEKRHRAGAATAVAATVTLGAGALLAFSTKKFAYAIVTFPDGSYTETKVKGKSDIHDAQREVIKFNALARA